jgi:acetyltransferase-like isoleucine patch superfamily enzyme
MTPSISRLSLGASAVVTAELPFEINPGAIVLGVVSVGAYTYIGHGCLIGSLRSIGRFCSVAPNVTVGLGNHPTDYVSTHPIFYGSDQFGKFEDVGTPRRADVMQPLPVIGHDVWIGANAYLARGVTIGHGAVIGGGAWVNDDVPPYSIAVGSPARVHRLRFPDATVARLLTLEWWNYPVEAWRGVPVDRIDDALSAFEDLLAKGLKPARYETAVHDAQALHTVGRGEANPPAADG